VKASSGTENSSRNQHHQEISQQRQQVAQAVQIFSDVISEDPADIQAALCLGDCYQEEERPDLAALVYLLAQEMDPESFHVQKRLSSLTE
jgi:Tfp pilus assembly protein PilF